MSPTESLFEREQNFKAFKEKFESFGDIKIAWLAGLFQGEATFSIDTHRITREPTSPDYKPAPGSPYIRLEMVEKDLIEHVGEILSKEAILENRLTEANEPKQVYKVTVCARDETEYVLKRIKPYVVGHLKSSCIKELLDVCNEFNQWEAEGGRVKAAKIANKASQEAKKAKQEADKAKQEADKANMLEQQTSENDET